MSVLSSRDDSPTVLLTNDDGIDAPGIQTLCQVLLDLGWSLGHNLMLVAPCEPHSGCGHQVTTHRPLTLDERSPGRFAIDGTPADCVRLAIAALCPRVSWVLSGINAGGNMGADVPISGTVAAVREAAYSGIPGIALSQYLKGRQPVGWSTTSLWAKDVLHQLMNQPPTPGHFWNVNFPWPEQESAPLPAIHFCEPDSNPLPLVYERQGDQFHYAGRYGQRQQTAGSDVAACFGGAIAITQLRAL